MFNSLYTLSIFPATSNRATSKKATSKKATSKILKLNKVLYQGRGNDWLYASMYEVWKCCYCTQLFVYNYSGFIEPHPKYDWLHTNTIRSQKILLLHITTCIQLVWFYRSTSHQIRSRSKKDLKLEFKYSKVQDSNKFDSIRCLRKKTKFATVQIVMAKKNQFRGRQFGITAIKYDAIVESVLILS